jgi:hypothetical protein
MLSFDDNRWDKLSAGYRTQFDPRAALSKLESNIRSEDAWNELWEGLHHQGDVGEASYAAVPHIVRIYHQRRGDHWRTFGLVTLIELARGRGTNPEIPNWLKQDYFQAIQNLAKIASTEVMREDDTYAVRAMLCVVAIAKGARTHARFLFEYSDEEMIALEKQMLGHRLPIPPKSR